MRATYVPSVKTPATAEHVSRGYRTALTALVGAPSDRAVAILHAHGALETGHFRSMYNWNCGNIKSSEDYAGLFTCFPILNEIFDGHTRWYTPEGELTAGPGSPLKGKPWAVPPGEPMSRFRAYETLASGIQDKIKFLSTPHWMPALQWALEGNAFEYVAAIKARNYMTANLAPYQRAVVQLTEKYLPVARATSVMAPPPPFPEDSPELCHDIAACFRFELPPELAARIRVQQSEHVDDALEQARKARDEEIQGG